MNKDTIEIERINKFISGYGRVQEVYEDSQITYDKLLEWARIPANLDKKVYRHKVRRVEENHSKTEVYKFRHQDCPSYDIPFCDLVYYLDIYWQ